jgi:hypothetical protein
VQFRHGHFNSTEGDYSKPGLSRNDHHGWRLNSKRVK